MKRLFVYCLVVAIALPIAPFGLAADKDIDLDANPLTGAESRIETNVLQSFPVEVENVITNNSPGTAFTFHWPGAGPGGFDAILTVGPDVGTKWSWTTVSQVYSITSPAEFEVDARGVPVFGAPTGGIKPLAGERIFDVPGKSINPTQVTLSSAALTSSLVTFFSPENTIATCESNFVPGRFEQTISNNTGETVTFSVNEPDCCPEPQMTICGDGCKSYLTDDLNCGGCGNECGYGDFCDQGNCASICAPGELYCNDVCVDPANDAANCGDCGVACAFDEFCDAGTCADICPGAGQEYCNQVCVDTLNDESNCGDCGITCAFDEFCDQGACADICPGAGQEYCNDVCVDTFNDDANCGDCGITCAFDEFCAGGLCGPICPGPGQAYCSQVCVDTLNDATNCGMCGVTCAFDEFCDQGACAEICPGVGQEYCNQVCVDTLNDTTNCGDCGITCAYDQFCDQGNCADICPGVGQEYCDGLCVDTFNDDGNCGDCGIACAADEYCDLGVCASSCDGEHEQWCGTTCADLYTDPANCGDCGNVCDPGLVCQDAVCKSVADSLAASQAPPGRLVPGAATMTAVPPQGLRGKAQAKARAALKPQIAPDTTTPLPPSVRRDQSALAAPSGAVVEATPELRARADGRRGRRVIDRRSTVVDAPAQAIPGVVEAPVCGVPPIEVEILDGESYTLCQSGALIGKEVFTTASVQQGGRTVGQGPCALIVPDMAATVQPFQPSPVSVTIVDASGDRLLQPGETADIFVEVLNVGGQDMINPVGVLSSPPDGFNPLPLVILGDTSAFPDFPALTQPADCDTEPVLEPRTNLVAFTISIPREHVGGVGRVFNLNLSGDVGGPLSVDMPLVLGIGEACEVAPGFDGETYDGLIGLLNPVDAALQPLNYPTEYGARAFHQADTIPLIIRLKCGEQELGVAELGPTPQLLQIVHGVAGSLPLQDINAGGGNVNDPFFTCGVSTCTFHLNASNLPTGRLRLEIRMPDSRVFQAGIRVIP